MSNTVEAVKERLTAAEIIGRRVQLRQAGRNLKGLCCFHSEKTPSFFVFPETNTYKCFGCNEGGDIFKWRATPTNLKSGVAGTFFTSTLGVQRAGRKTRCWRYHECLEFEL
ncbi:MAG: CHC2 zinc finger domain-containing protein [Rhodospirillales bacterium]|nr:CHC2 zinc finger domain-containing protein [Rhodospirillales bacterium]